MEQKEETWVVNTEELFENDLIESGDIIAFRGKTWREQLEKTGENSYYDVGIVYYPNKDIKMFFRMTNKGVEFRFIEELSSFILIKSGVKWNKKADTAVEAYTVNPKLHKYNFIASLTSIFDKNKFSVKFFSSTFVVNFLNLNGYKLTQKGMTPTRLVEQLINIIGRKIIEVKNVRKPNN